MTPEEQKALERIKLMLPRTEARGASPAEAEAAAKHIGRLLMKFPQLLNATTTSSYSYSWSPPPRQRPQAEAPDRFYRKPDVDYVTLRHYGIVSKTEKAVLVRFNGGMNLWIPKSQIGHLGPNDVVVTQWWWWKVQER